MTLALAIAALVVSAVTVIAVARQVTEAKKSNTLPTAIDLFREYRSIEMERARRLLADQMPRLDTTRGMQGLPEDVAVAAAQVSHYLDNLGLLVARGLVDPELATGFLGENILRTWQDLSPFILRERELRSQSNYQPYFEHLVATVQQIAPVQAHANLRRFGGGPGEQAGAQPPDRGRASRQRLCRTFGGGSRHWRVTISRD